MPLKPQNATLGAMRTGLRRKACAALALAAACAAGARAGAEPKAARVERGNLEVRVKVMGTVVPDDVFRIKSTIEGRVETVLTGTYTWRGADQHLAFLAHKELAAMLDAKGAQNQEILEDRWQRVYRPTPVRCPDTCFILKSYVKARSWVKPEALLFEAAKTLKMVARVRPEDAPWVRDGQELVFWPVKDPKRRLRGRVARFLLDIQGEKVSPGAAFTLIMTPDRYFEPGTEWEGEIVPLEKKGVLFVPTGALLRHGDSVYLPVKVSTGLTTQGLTQVTAGVEEKREYLVPDESLLPQIPRHKQEVDLEALRRRAREQQAAQGVEPMPEDDSRSAPSAPKKSGKHAEVMDDSDYGEDPYAEP